MAIWLQDRPHRMRTNDEQTKVPTFVGTTAISSCLRCVREHVHRSDILFTNVWECFAGLVWTSL